MIILIISQASHGNVLNGNWTLNNAANFVFTDTYFSASERDTADNSDLIEYRCEGPYELRGDTIVWFNKYIVKDNLTAGKVDTVHENKGKIENVDTFYLGINLNGPNVQIANQKWSSSAPMVQDSSLKLYGFGDFEPLLTNYKNITGVTGDSLLMLQSSIENNPSDDGIAFSISIPDTPRHYRLYIWYCRPDSITNKPEDFRFTVYGSNNYDKTPNVDTAITKIGNWRRIGPYHSDSKSVIEIHAMTEAHNFTDKRRVSVSGIEINRGPSIKDVNTFRYLYKTVGDSLYLKPIEEELFSSVALKKNSANIKQLSPVKINIDPYKYRKEPACFNILGRKVIRLRSSGLILSPEIEGKRIQKRILLKGRAQ